MTKHQEKLYKALKDQEEKVHKISLDTSYTVDEYRVQYSRYEKMRYAAMAAGIEEVARDFATGWADTLAMDIVAKPVIEDVIWQLESNGYDEYADMVRNA